MQKILFFIALLAILWSACKKADLPANQFGTPVFHTSFEADSIQLSSLTAGEMGKYLFTRVNMDSLGVLVLSGSFAPSDCPTGNCPESVSFIFRNKWLENFAPVDEILTEGQFWKYTSPTDSMTPLQFQTVAIRWTRSDGAVFGSDFIPQDSIFSNFTIQSSEPWELNERGEKTWKMTVNFGCKLFSPGTQQLFPVFGSGVIAVAYQ